MDPNFETNSENITSNPSQMEENNISSQNQPNNRPHKNMRAVLSWFVILVVCLVGVVLFVIFKTKIYNRLATRNSSKLSTSTLAVVDEQQSQVSQENDSNGPEMDSQVRNLLSTSKINFPKIASTKAMQASDLPADVRALVDLAARSVYNVQIDSVIYDSSQTGYRISYYKSDSAVSTELPITVTVALASGWKPLINGLSASLFGLVEFQNDNAFARVSLFNRASNLQVLIQVINNQ